ncbi:hypothetical protein [Paraburkholderia youngii]|uniref:hypothetical protein n=1 Tax=Paraburkholderia youngii TaxID=2782701 RepID=UPI003D1AF160
MSKKINGFFLLATLSLSACITEDRGQSIPLSSSEFARSLKLVVDHGDLSDYKFLGEALHLGIVRRPEEKTINPLDDKLLGYTTNFTFSNIPSEYERGNLSYSYFQPTDRDFSRVQFLIFINRDSLCVKTEQIKGVFGNTAHRHPNPHSNSVGFFYQEDKGIRISFDYVSNSKCLVSISMSQNANRD